MIAIIPARSGSKGLPCKNIKPLADKPLIAYTVEAAVKSTFITDVIISTDSQEIYDIAVEYGAKATFLRPAHLATDEALAVDNYIYTINKLNSEFGYDIENFIVLQPTSPLRTGTDIDKAITLFNDKGADSVVSYTEASHPIGWHKYINTDQTFENIFPENINNRQTHKVSYYPNGAIFIFSYELIKTRQYYSNNSFAYIMSRKNSVDIDTIDDFNYAEYLLRSAS